MIAQVNHRISAAKNWPCPPFTVDRDGTESIGPSHRDRLPNVASQMRVAFSSIALKTGSSSPG